MKIWEPFCIFFFLFLPVSLVSFFFSSTPRSFSLSPSSLNWVRLGSLRSKCPSRKHPIPISRLCCRECHNRRREGFLKGEERRVHTHSTFPLPPLCYSHHSVNIFIEASVLVYVLPASRLCVFLSGRWPYAKWSMHFILVLLCSV